MMLRMAGRLPAFARSAPECTVNRRAGRRGLRCAIGCVAEKVAGGGEGEAHALGDGSGVVGWGLRGVVGVLVAGGGRREGDDGVEGLVHHQAEGFESLCVEAFEFGGEGLCRGG